MIDNLSLGLAHALLLYAAWRLLSRADLDHDGPGDGNVPEAPRWGRRG